MAQIIDVVEVYIVGPQGKGGTIESATAKGLAAGAAPTVKLGGTPEKRTIEFGIPKGDTGTPATITSATAETLPPQSEVTVTVGGTPSARTFKFGIPKGDPGAGSVSSVNGKLGPDIVIGAADVGAVSSVNGKTGQAVTIGATDVGGSTAATSGTLPMRQASGRVPGIGTPVAAAEAANKGYVDQKIATALESTASVDELIFTSRHDCGYAGTSAIVEFTTTTSHTVMVAPFPLEITSVVLSFERFSIERHASNYVRAWPQKGRDGVNTPMAAQKNTSTGSGGEAIATRKAWSLTDGGITDGKMAKDDLLMIVLGVTGAPGPIQYPFTATVKYRPL